MAALVAGLTMLVGAAGAQQPPSRAYTYNCDINGKKLNSDRLIPECNDRPQRRLNPDGSLNSIIQPTLTEDERTAAEAREREANAERVARNDAIRRDRNLTARFPDEAAHQKAREKALDDIRKAVLTSEYRIAELLKDRKKLLEDAEFYLPPAKLPPKLKLDLDANDATLAAQKSLVVNQQAEVVRISGLYDAELVRLKKLWSGAQPGSLGPLPQATPVVDGKRSSR